VNYTDAVEWLYGLQLHGIKLGLENMRRLCATLGIRTESDASCAFIHVAGTNGKGSVCAMIDAACRAGGLATGLYTSPHLVTFRERIRLNGAMISEGEVAAGLTRLREATADWDHAATFFEITTAIALAWFQQRGAEIVVLETGLGGRLDATNVVTPRVAAITPVALDHTQWLGATIAEIAAEKAGIIKAGVPVVVLPQPPEAERVFRETAERTGAPLRFIDRPVADDIPLSLPGQHQRWNAALALGALAAAGVHGDHSPALHAVDWPGRFQQVGDRLILDGAHNPDAAANLVATWRERFGDEKATLILGAMRDKDIAGVCAALRQIAARVIATAVENPRACPPGELCGIVRATDHDWPCEAAEDFAAALSAAGRHAGRILVAGSLFLVGEALAHLDPASPRPELSAQ
jgi:dihydrofolate synthase / folylpolyglutamate synthase